MAVPRALRFAGLLPKDADLGKPLATHDEVALPSIASDRDRKLVVKDDVEGDGLVGGHRARELDLHHGVIVHVAIVGRDELHRLRDVTEAVGGDCLDLDSADLLGRVGVFDGANAAVGLGFIREA